MEAGQPTEAFNYANCMLPILSTLACTKMDS